MAEGEDAYQTIYVLNSFLDLATFGRGLTTLF
jgi:hypothetical protein